MLSLVVGGAGMRGAGALLLTARRWKAWNENRISWANLRISCLGKLGQNSWQTRSRSHAREAGRGARRPPGHANVSFLLSF